MSNFLNVWPKQNLLSCGMCYASVDNVRRLTGLSLVFLDCPVPFYTRPRLFGRGLPVLLPNKIFLNCSFFPGPIGTRDILLSSPFNSVEVTILCFRFVNCRNLFNHCLGVNIGFPSVPFASKFGTIFFSVMGPVEEISVCLKTC